MKVVMKKIGEIKPYEKNPRNNEASIGYVANSIKQFGFWSPIVIDKDNIIVAGHTRYEAAIRLGLNKVPTVKADDLTDEEVRAYRLVDNKTAELSEWDFDKLKEELSKCDNFKMDDFGFSIDEIVKDNVIESGEAEEKEQPEKKIVCPRCGHEVE